MSQPRTSNDVAFPADRRYAWRRPALLCAAAFAIAAAVRIAGAFEPLAIQVADVGPRLSRPLSLLTGALPFAVGELLAVAYALWLIARGGLAVRDVVRSRRSWGNALAGGAHRAARHGAILLIAFFVLFGANYQRPAWAASAALPEWTPAEPAELARLAEAALDATNAAYLALHGMPDAGVPTAMPVDARTIDTALDRGWLRAAPLLGLHPAASARYGSVKWPRSSGALARLGLAGVYFPFTAEANVVRTLPALRAPVTMAHEKAHQRGTASEAEASFFGFVAAALAPHPLARYSAASFAQSHLLGVLYLADADAATRLRARRLPGVQRDYDDLFAYYERYTGIGQSLGSAVNDAYLRANQVSGGVDDYRRAWRLIVAYARENDGRLMPE